MRRDSSCQQILSSLQPKYSRPGISMCSHTAWPTKTCTLLDPKATAPHLRWDNRVWNQPHKRAHRPKLSSLHWIMRGWMGCWRRREARKAFAMRQKPNMAFARVEPLISHHIRPQTNQPRFMNREVPCQKCTKPRGNPLPIARKGLINLGRSLLAFSQIRHVSRTKSTCESSPSTVKLSQPGIRQQAPPVEHFAHWASVRNSESWGPRATRE